MNLIKGLCVCVCVQVLHKGVRVFVRVVRLQIAEQKKTFACSAT